MSGWTVGASLKGGPESGDKFPKRSSKRKKNDFLTPSSYAHVFNFSMEVPHGFMNMLVFSLFLLCVNRKAVLLDFKMSQILNSSFS